MEKCILCEGKATINEQNNASRTIYHCQNCGVFVVSDVVAPNVKTHACQLAAYLTHRKLAGHNEVILLTYDQAKKDKDYLQLTVEQILGHYPRSYSELMDMVLINLSHLSSYEGAEIKVENLEMAPVFFIKKISYDALSFVIKSMQKMELLEVNYYSSSFFPCGVIISPKGWDRISQLENGRVGRDLTLILHTGKDDDTNNTFRTVAVKAAGDCGYHGVEGSDASSVGKINHEMIALMKGSSFLITDLSEPTGAAYYSMGLAASMGRTNILTCHVDSYNKLQLDHEQISVLPWEDEKTLYQQVINAIRAIVE